MGLNPSFLPGRNFSLNTVGIIQLLVELSSARVQLRSSLSKAIAACSQQANKHYVNIEYNIDDFVYLKSSKLPLPYQFTV